MSLKILLDQNVSPQICHFIASLKPSFEVKHVNDVGLNGASDDLIFRWAQNNTSLVITFDEDFADARMYPVGSHAGVIRLRVWPTTIENTEAALTRVFEAVSEAHMRGSLIIVDQKRIRIRRSAVHG